LEEVIRLFFKELLEILLEHLRWKALNQSFTLFFYSDIKKSISVDPNFACLPKFRAQTHRNRGLPFTLGGFCSLSSFCDQIKVVFLLIMAHVIASSWSPAYHPNLRPD
jgi:hypothetical protein